MKPKQRFISALQFQAPDDMVAFMEVEFHLYREAWGKEPIVGQEYARLSAKEKE